MYRMKLLAAVVLLAACRLQIASSAFGDDISANNEDNTFQDMGQATLENFNVDSGNLDLVVHIENTGSIPEYWLMDFQPFLFNMNRLPIDEATGTLTASNTGNCSSVYESANFDDFLSDSYFQDKDTTELGANGKLLYTGFTRGTTTDENNRRTDVIVASIGMDVFFACENSNYDSIWDLTSEDADDEIEYRTNLYMTNVRPKDATTASDGIAFVQSHVELIWRISRTALANVIISSIAILWPKVDFVKVSAVFDADGDPIADQARLKLRFTTVADSEEQMAVYQENGVSFLPDNIAHSVLSVDESPGTTIGDAPPCVFEFDRQTGTQKQCHQTWDFTILLDIDVPLEDFTNQIPIDASGTFDFLFDVYDCDAPANDVIDTSTCSVINDDVTVSTVITIQTTIFVIDEEKDSITIILLALTGVNSDALNVPEAVRGVAHKELVTMDVTFSPSLLRNSFDLDLTLFMVCVGEKYTEDAYPNGCLEAPLDERYVAHMDNDFLYYNYTTTDLNADILQNLESDTYYSRDEGVTHDMPYHRSIFTNLALSEMKRNYTITTVYKLVETENGGRRRKRNVDKKIILSKHLIGENSQVIIKDRAKRSIEDDVDNEHLTQAGYIAAGCPANSVHDAETFDCICQPEYYYNERTLECTSELNDILLADNPVSDNSRPIFSISSIMISVFLFSVMILK